ncbi:T9SS type A sorting domain-containing protein [Neolewinella persica]|uniref:T9SS type A sorting domain-containing protein n=1 Tax=Neolewinella persica TaxID=70998 RepID=UPI00039FF46D|nr:T9SS type A sorting domain-containing protein [Neolewinella persica]
MKTTFTNLSVNSFTRSAILTVLLSLLFLLTTSILTGQDCNTDTTGPQLTTRPLNLTLNTSGTAMVINPSLLVNTVSDNCSSAGQIVVTVTPSSFSCAEIGDNEVQVTATDASGNATTVTATVTVGFVEPAFSCIAQVNLTLNNNCQATIIPSMLLTGNMTCINEFPFNITVEDNDPSNGPIVDGCGRFRYTITSIGTGDLDLAFTSCWGFVNAEDKTPPAIVTVPADVELLCVDIDDNRLTTLPNTINRCYRVNAETGATIAGTMAPALRDRLLAGGTQALVPVFTDGCANEIEVCVSDALTFDASNPDCEDVFLTRRFVAREIALCTSASGIPNASVVASYKINFTRPTLDNLNGENLPVVVNYEQCGVQSPTRADYPAPRATDFPFLAVGNRVFPLTSGQSVCNIGVTYSDGNPVITCPFTYKFVRTYTVIDWCNPSDIRTFNQVVKVGDTTAPSFTGPNVPTNGNGDLIYGTNAGNICAAYLRLDDVRAVDNCSGTNVNITAQIFPGGNVNASPIGAFVVVPGGLPELSTAIPAGRHLLRYTYSDQCGNTGTSDYFFVIEDKTPPVAICEDGLNILATAGSNTGFAVLTPANIDNGSYDDCSGVTLSIARIRANNTVIGTYSNQINLTCEDIGTVRVGLRVADALGNENFCWLDVRVEDKLAPSCIAPGNLTLNCEDYRSSLPNNIQDASTATLDAIFGVAAGVDNCSAAITQTISGGINNCGVGSFTRTFRSTDPSGFSNTCTQRINVIGVNDYRLALPTDEAGSCAEIPAYAGIVADQFGCDLMTTTTKVDTFRTLLAGDECFKLRITYDVVNWCEYNSLGEPYVIPRNGNGVLNRQRSPRNLDTDVLYVNVIANNTATKSDDQAFMTLFTDRVYSPSAPQNDQLVAANYANSNGRGFFRYVQFIKIYDEVAPEITFTEPAACFSGNGDGCRGTVAIEFNAQDECSRAVVGVELDADYVAANGFSPVNAASLGIGVTTNNDGTGNFTVTATNVPVGAHALRVRAADGCGNFDVQIIEFCVEADRSPTPICIQTLTVVLADDGNGGGSAAIWASDFIASPIEDCFGNEVTKYSIFRSSVAGNAGFVPRYNPPTTNGVTDIDCDDFVNGTVNVRIYAFDNNGTTPDFCSVVVEVQDNAGHCAGNATGDLSGQIATFNNESLRNVTVSLTGNNGADMETTTNVSGAFSFTNLTLGGDYTVQPDFDAPVNLRNVKSSDLVKMISVILGTESFDSPYDYVAADVNRDRYLDIFDVLNTSKLILGQIDQFAGGASWVFVPTGTVINAADPYRTAFPEVYNVNDLAATLRNVNFVAIEIGNPFNIGGRSSANLQVQDTKLNAGQMHTIVLDGTALAAFQGTLELGAGLELISAEYTGEGGINLNRAGEGMIAIALRDNAKISLEVRATTAVRLSEALVLTDAITVLEGVSANGLSNGLGLAFNAEVAPAAALNVLYQNMPNPVVSTTVIRFELAAAAPATLTLRDAAGRLVSVQKIDAAAGLNVVELTDIKASGVLTYTLTAGEFTASKKMVVVK